MARKQGLKERLFGKLSQKELDSLIRAFDLFGNIAVIEIPKKLEKKEKLIATALMELNKHIKTVCKITSAHTGKYRVQKIKFLAGEKNFIARHKEFGCAMEFDLSKVFFSPRLSTERKRISDLIQPNEIVAVFFAGVGPFALVFAKHSKAKKIFAIELNPIAVKYLKKNIALNKCTGKIEAIQGDVKKVAPKFRKAFDRIVMPLPRGGEDFLDSALVAVKPKGVIHFYQFVEKEKLFEEPLKKIELACKKKKKKFKVLNKRVVRSFSPAKIQVVLDFKIFS